MKYILGIGLEFKYFKGETKIRIFSKDKFIDEILLDDHIPCTLKKRKIMKPNDSFGNQDTKTNLGFSKILEIPLPNKLFLYEIDESCLGEKIIFEMNDKNSNHTNGFMTKSNLVKFQTIFLMPKSSLKEENYTKLLGFMQKRFNKYDPYEEDGYNLFGPWKAFVIDWPGTQFLYNSNGENVRLHWLGGRNTCHVYLRKKFRIYQIWPGRTTNAGYPTVQGIPELFINYIHHYNLLNIYNEDQRSNHT
jgi:hypothetical protein